MGYYLIIPGEITTSKIPPESRFTIYYYTKFTILTKRNNMRQEFRKLTDYESL
jgi:hypothetical protein